MIAISTLLIGAAVGLRYRVIALLPILMAGAGIATYFFVAGHQTLSQSVLAIVTYGVLLQIGYAVGSLASVICSAPRTIAGKTMTATTR